MPFLRRLTLFAVMIAALPFLSAAAEAPVKPSPEQIAQWIHQLGDDNFTKREEASKKLSEAGEAAETALQEAIRSQDAEVSRRAADVMERFKWGLYPEAPIELVDLVKRYRSSSPQNKTVVIRELLKAGPSASRTLLKIVRAEDKTIREELFTSLQVDLARKAPRLIADENYDDLLPLAEVLLAADGERGAGYYAAYWQMRGKLDEHIAELKKKTGNDPEGKRTWEIMAYLYHAKGDLAAARDAAAKADNSELVDGLLFEAGDWKELTQSPGHPGTNNPPDALGFRAAFHRLAGNAAAFEKDLADARGVAYAAPMDVAKRFHLATILFLNDRPKEATEVAVHTPGLEPEAFEFLVKQLNYKEALELADKAIKAGSKQAPKLEILKARTLYSLGEKEKAVAIFTRYGDNIKRIPSRTVWDDEELIDAEYRVGLKEQSLQHAAQVLSVSEHKFMRGRLFAKFFPKNAEAAESLWAILRSGRSERPEATMKSLRSLLDGTADPKFLSDVVERASVKVGSNIDDPETAKRLCGAAEAALACRDETLARSLLEKAEKFGSADALIRLGDLDADKKEWTQAADHYLQAWKKSLTQPLPYYLNGWALAQSGQVREGNKRMEQAHWMLLSDGKARIDFLAELQKRSHHEAVRREAELVLRLSAPGSHHYREPFNAAAGMRQLAIVAMNRKEYFLAAQWQEQAMLNILSTGVTFAQDDAYLTIPAFVHRLRAQGYSAAGDFDAAQREADLCLTALPGDLVLPVALVPMWDKAGRKKEATELFARCLAVQEKLCDAYPNSTLGPNGAAWLSACCRRNLDSAQKHALKAVEMAPDNADALDTLAEVEFQLGNKDQAVVAQKKAVELEPKRAYLRMQLKRIKAGDPGAERPEEE